MTHPLRANSTRQLAALQRQMARVIMQPLTRDYRTTRFTPDGESTAQVAATFIKPNDRLAAVERIELYNKQYWFRFIDSMYEDFPGLIALLGQARFDRLLREYLVAHPSRSYTLRDLGERLPEFLAKNPGLAGRRARIAVELATLEWAQIVAFDSAAKTPVVPEDLHGLSPGKIKLAIQPYVTLLTLSYPLDQYLTSLRRATAEHGGSSNTLPVDSPEKTAKKARTAPVPRPAPTTLAVHRHNHGVYRKRLHPCALLLLQKLDSGKSLAAALDAAFDPALLPRWAQSQIPPAADRPGLINTWFADWSALGWLTLRR